MGGRRKRKVIPGCIYTSFELFYQSVVSVVIGGKSFFWDAVLSDAVLVMVGFLRNLTGVVMAEVALRAAGTGNDLSTAGLGSNGVLRNAGFFLFVGLSAF